MYDITIIGCGVVGASIAYNLSHCQGNFLVLERENDIAMGTTKANSAIVHAGYDPVPGSLMAKLNVRGSALMEDLCKRLSVAYKRTGSMVAAFSQEDRASLDILYQRGVENGVQDLQILDGDQARALEPALSPQVTAVLLAPSAAVVDPWGLCIAEMEVAVRNGVELRLNSPVTGIRAREGYFELETPEGQVETRAVINCAGCHAEEVSAMAGTPGFHTTPSRGQYYLLDKSSGDLVHHVIFQCPDRLGKGVLVAPTVHGNLIVGPNAEPSEADDTATTRKGLDQVAATARHSVPSVDLRQCIRNFAGVRANTDHEDFIIGPLKEHPFFIQVAGIRSPGLSAAPAIGEYVVDLVKETGISLVPKEHYSDGRTVVRFKDLTQEEKLEMVRKNPLYGRVICRCETITEGEIVDAIHSPIPPCSIDGIKRRAGAGMGRCQGGFCGPRVMEILARELGVPQEQIGQDQNGTYIISGKLK